MSALATGRGLAIAGRLEPTDVELGPSSLTALIGPNGSGKTSLLRALAGIGGSRGAVTIAGERLSQAPSARRRALLGFLPASREVAWPIAVRSLIELGVNSPDPARVDALIEALELGALGARPIDRLSTGERARVLLARALAARPRLLLLDEPLSNLDPYWALRTLDLLRGEAHSGGAAVLLSLHDLAMARRFERLLMMDRGRLVADDPPAKLLTSEAFARAFRVELGNDGWRIIRPEHRRSSP